MNIRRRSKRIASKRGTGPSAIIKKRKVEAMVISEPPTEDDGIDIVERPTKRIKKSMGDDAIKTVGAEDVLMQQLTGLMINGEKEPAQKGSILDQDPTHKVIDGPLKGYQVAIFQKQGLTDTLVLLLVNARGNKMQEPLMWKVVPNDRLQELDSYDMIGFAEDLDEAEEDQSLIEHEMKKWECPKCEAQVSEENGVCPEFLDGVQCGGTRKVDKLLGWGGCFAEIAKTWTCPVCTLPNPIDQQDCTICSMN